MLAKGKPPVSKQASSQEIPPRLENDHQIGDTSEINSRSKQLPSTAHGTSLSQATMCCEVEVIQLLFCQYVAVNSKRRGHSQAAQSYFVTRSAIILESRQELET